MVVIVVVVKPHPHQQPCLKPFYNLLFTLVVVMVMVMVVEAHEWKNGC